MVKSEYNEILKKYICEIHFTKADGSLRVMKCTLRADYVQKHQIPVKLNEDGSEVVPKPVPETQVRVIDIEADAWRSFNIDSVKVFKVTV